MSNDEGASGDPDDDRETDPDPDRETDSDAGPQSSDVPDWKEDPDPDPPSLGPGPPEVDIPEIETSDSLTGDADPELARTFWRLVLVLDVGLLAVALGLMFVYFEGNWNRGLTLVGFGAAVLGYGLVRYRRYRAEDRAEDASDVAVESEAEPSPTEDPKG